jgi:hypothetical protein
MHIKLRKFDMSSIRDDKIVVLIGKRETGKSFLVKDLLYYHQDIPMGTVVSPTEKMNQYFSKIIPPLFIHHEYNHQIVQNFLKRQDRIVTKMVKGVPEYQNVDPRSFLLFDDCLADNQWVKEKSIRTLFMNGRHYKAMFIITMQFALGITPNLRTNIDYVFILREPNFSNRKKLYEHYCGMFPTFEIFCQVMDQCTEDFECLVINNNAKTNKIEDQVFWYKASPHEEFRMCDKVIWEHSDKYCVDEDDEEDFKSSVSMNQRRRGPTITVKKY